MTPIVGYASDVDIFRRTPTFGGFVIALQTTAPPC
jgi:hypothetical protein